MNRNQDNRTSGPSRYRRTDAGIRLVERDAGGTRFSANARGVGKSGSSPRRRRANRRRGRWGFFALPVAALAAALICAAHSPRFNIRSVSVRGNRLVAVSEIEKTAQIHPGDNLLGVSSRSVRHRLLAIPAIAAVRLDREFPGKLIIEINERRPWAAVLAGQKTFLVDREWRVIARVKCAPARLPTVIIKSPTRSEIPAGGQIVRQGSLAAALGCLRETLNPTFGVPITHVFIDAKRNIWLNMMGMGARVNLGLADRLGAKLATLQMIYRRSPELLKNAQSLDLQNADAPAYAPRRAAAATAGGA